MKKKKGYSVLGDSSPPEGIEKKKVSHREKLHRSPEKGTLSNRRKFPFVTFRFTTLRKARQDMGKGRKKKMGGKILGEMW